MSNEVMIPEASNLPARGQLHRDPHRRGEEVVKGGMP